MLYIITAAWYFPLSVLFSDLSITETARTFGETWVNLCGSLENDGDKETELLGGKPVPLPLYPP
jgi:hypothetical protein